MRVIQVSASPNPLPPKQSCFPSAVAIQTKGYKHWKRGEGREGHQDFSYELEDEFLGRRGEFSIQCLNLFATACSLQWRVMLGIISKLFTFEKIPLH